jgi:hypothetical protein
MGASVPSDGPAPIRTKLNFKRPSSGSGTSKHRKPNSGFHRQPDFDLTQDEEPPLPGISKVFWPDKFTFKDALISARADPDEAKHWKEVFGTDIHVFPKPSLAMSDDEYAAWVRERVYERVLLDSRARKRAAEEAEREQRRYRAQQEAFRQAREQEQERIRNYMRSGMGTRTGEWNLRSKAPKEKWLEYIAALQPPPSDADLLLLWQKSDVPWPTPSGQEDDISEENIRRFIRTCTMQYAEDANGDWKKAVRINQYYWHPDKFRQIQAQKLEKLSDTKKEEVLRRVTDVSQILNKLAAESG